MKICCISDTHGHYDFDVPDADVLVFAGDISHNRCEDINIENFVKWISPLPHKHKIVIAGNHDFHFENFGRPNAFHDEIIYLHQTSVVIDGIKFYGSSFQPRFYDWAFNVRRGEPLKLIWDMIPDDANVLLTHTPPYGIMDVCGNGSVGCEDLMNRIHQLSELKLHVFGHIHESYGVEEHDGVMYVNASLCDGYYRQVNKPIVVHI